MVLAAAFITISFNTVKADGDGHDIGYQCSIPTSCTEPPPDNGGNNLTVLNIDGLNNTGIPSFLEYLTFLLGKQ